MTNRITPSGPYAQPRTTRYRTDKEQIDSILAALAGAGVTDPVQREMLAAHLVREIGWSSHGAGIIRNCNPGNVKAFASYTGQWTRQPDGLAYRSWDSLAQGMRDYLQILALPRYAPAVAKLHARDESWYGDLVEAGYSEEPSEARREYPSILRRVRALAGPAKPLPGAIKVGLIALALRLSGAFAVSGCTAAQAATAGRVATWLEAVGRCVIESTATKPSNGGPDAAVTR